jgi:hypothetical protein
MAHDLELDPLFDRTMKARTRRFVRKLMDSRYMMIALFLHILILLIFGGKVIFEAVRKVEIEVGAVRAPSGGPPSPPPAAPMPEKQVDVKVPTPKTAKFSQLLATDKLSTDFQVALPEVSAIVSTAFEASGIGGTGSAGGVPGGTGMAKINFFGIQTQASKMVFVVDISGSMLDGNKIGNSFRKVEMEVAKGVRALSEENEFNIIVFSQVAMPYKETMVKASMQEKERAISWLNRMSPERSNGDFTRTVNGVANFHKGTHVHLAMDEAFKFEPPLIIFISDGAPTGKKPDDILDQVRGLQSGVRNRSSINAVFYKTSNNGDNNKAKDFMTRLCRENGGEFKAIE